MQLFLLWLRFKIWWAATQLTPTEAPGGWKKKHKALHSPQINEFPTAQAWTDGLNSSMRVQGSQKGLRPSKPFLAPPILITIDMISIVNIEHNAITMLEYWITCLILTALDYFVMCPPLIPLPPGVPPPPHPPLWALLSKISLNFLIISLVYENLWITIIDQMFSHCCPPLKCPLEMPPSICVPPSHLCYSLSTWDENFLLLLLLIEKNILSISQCNETKLLLINQIIKKYIRQQFRCFECIFGWHSTRVRDTLIVA